MKTIDERTELLVSRAVGGDAAAHEWDELTSRADADVRVWRELGVSLRDQSALAAIVAGAGERAESVAAPRMAGHGAAWAPAWRGSMRLASWAGWAVAAGLAIAIGGRWLGAPAAPEALPAQTAGISTPADATLVRNAQEALEAYLERGRSEERVIQQMPRMLLLEARPNPTGEGYEILYLRQLMERAVVPDLYQFGAEDEAGRPALVRYQRPSGGGS
jgi:hypothetical protein